MADKRDVLELAVRITVRLSEVRDLIREGLGSDTTGAKNKALRQIAETLGFYELTLPLPRGK